jgi:lysozyme family protein
MESEYAAGKDFTASGGNFTAKGEVLSEFRSLQADLNNFAQVAGFEGVKIDGILGPRTLDAVKKVLAAVLAKNSLLVPATFTADTTEDVAKYALRIRDWLQTTASKTLDVATFRVLKKGEGQDWNIKGDIAYGKGAVHDEFLGIQRELNKLAKVVGFAPLDTDGFIGPKTAAAVKQTYDKLVAMSPMYGITLFPPPNTKEETAAFAQFIHGWLKDTASKQLLGTANA